MTRVAIAVVLSPAAPIDRSSPSFSGVHRNSGALISSPSARALQDDVYSRWPFVCLWPRRSVSNSRRSKLCPFSSRVTSKVARHPRASMVGLRSAGLASLRLRLEPELDQAADGFGTGRLRLLLCDPGV